MQLSGCPHAVLHCTLRCAACGAMVCHASNTHALSCAVNTAWLAHFCYHLVLHHALQSAVLYCMEL